jgi:hypothetical protein
MEWLRQSEASQVNTNLPIAESVQLPMERKASTDTHEMTIISATKSTRYKLVNGQMVVQKDIESDLDSAATSDGYPGAGYSPYTPPFKSNSSGGASSNSTQPIISTPPVDPDVATQPNLTWDPTSGVWQSGGFKATYPSGK